MPAFPDSLALFEARRLALAAQGFDQPRPGSGVTARHLRRLIRQLGLVQLDFVNVLVPAHYQVLFSRLGPYRRSLLHELVYARHTQPNERPEQRRRGGYPEFTEQWAHEASIVSVETWPLLRHRREQHRPRPWGFEKFMEQHPDYVARVLDEVRARGPIAAEDLEELAGFDRAQFGRIPGALWGVAEDDPRLLWVGTVQRAVLEAHFGRGLLAITARRSDFSRLYDLAERVIPPEHYGRDVEREEAERALLLQAARALGVGTAGDLADYYRMSIRETRPRLAELVAAGRLREVRVEGWREPAYLDPGARLPQEAKASALLSPFDPLIWCRERVARLFDFDYRVEIFVPREKRRWGYYVLPFLFGERLVARVDLKADRDGRRLMVLAAYREPGGKPPAASQNNFPRGEIAAALARELRTLSGWLELESVVVERRGDFALELDRACTRQ
jgi:uncharacterized protein